MDIFYIISGLGNDLFMMLNIGGYFYYPLIIINKFTLFFLIIVIILYIILSLFIYMIGLSFSKYNKKDTEIGMYNLYVYRFIPFGGLFISFLYGFNKGDNGFKHILFSNIIFYIYLYIILLLIHNGMYTYLSGRIDAITFVNDAVETIPIAFVFIITLLIGIFGILFTKISKK